ncbi:hypothetical protein LSH36_367g03018, partial [Paralvinella palmiformis]
VIACFGWDCFYNSLPLISAWITIDGTGTHQERCRDKRWSRLSRAR